MANNTVTLQTVCRKLSGIESRLEKVEHMLVPKMNLSRREMAELERIRADIRKGETISEKELFAALSE